MKMNNFLKTGFFAIIFIVLSVGAKAQSNTNYVEFDHASGYESTDTVTVGSRMPYYMPAQTPVTGLTFEYKWVFDPGMTVLNYAGDANAPAGTGTGFYKENEISVVMPGTAGSVKISTNVQTLSGTTLLCPPGADVDYPIQVVPAPSMIWDNTSPMILCKTIDADVSVDIQLTGYGQWEVAYRIVKTDLEDANPGAPIDRTATIGTSKDKVGTTASDFELLIDDADFSGIGIYTITITSLTDRISRKSLDAVNGTLPATTFKINVYPVPTTNKLQHVRNVQ